MLKHPPPFCKAIMIHLSLGTSAVSVSFPSLLLSPLPPSLFFLYLSSYTRNFKSRHLHAIRRKRLSYYTCPPSMSLSLFCQETQYCITPRGRRWDKRHTRWRRPSHTEPEQSLLLPYFLASAPTQSQYVVFFLRWVGGLLRAAGKQSDRHSPSMSDAENPIVCILPDIA